MPRALIQHVKVASFIGLTIFLLSFGVAADELKDSLFAEASAALREANNELAGVLAPESYENGANAYQSADKRYDKGQKVSRVEKELADATAFFRQSIEKARQAQMVFKTAVQARTDAKGVDAEQLAAEVWQDAEKKFLSATRTLEVGKRDRAEARAADAEVLYREAELLAIKGNYLNKTRSKIEEADDLKVKRYAPDSLQKAKDLLAKAEVELSENRYDTDYPRALVKESFYEAKHSIYLAEQVRALDKGKITAEQLILKMEQPLADIAGQLNVVAEFDRGTEEPLQLISQKLESLIQDSHDLAELKKKMVSLEESYAALETRLGIQSERIKQQEEARRRLKQVDDLFSREEAVVLTQDDNVLIRLIGLSFAPGSAQISTTNFAVLKKLEHALQLYPGYKIVIEGHTDSFGSNEANQVLSQNRAQSVREYLLVHLKGISANRLEAKGYGETRPIANNETVAGRKANRRIDLLLQAP